MVIHGGCRCPFARAVDSNNSGINSAKIGDFALANSSFHQALSIIRQEPLLLLSSANGVLVEGAGNDTRRIVPPAEADEEGPHRTAAAAPAGCRCALGTTRISVYCDPRRENQESVGEQSSWRRSSRLLVQPDDNPQHQDKVVRQQQPQEPAEDQHRPLVDGEALRLLPANPEQESGPIQNTQDDRPPPHRSLDERHRAEGFIMEPSFPSGPSTPPYRPSVLDVRTPRSADVSSKITLFEQEEEQGSLPSFCELFYINVDHSQPQQQSVTPDNIHQESFSSSPNLLAAAQPSFPLVVSADAYPDDEGEVLGRITAVNLAVATIVFNCAVAHHLLHLQILRRCSRNIVDEERSGAGVCCNPSSPITTDSCCHQNQPNNEARASHQERRSKLKARRLYEHSLRTLTTFLDELDDAAILMEQLEHPDEDEDPQEPATRSRSRGHGVSSSPAAAAAVDSWIETLEHQRSVYDLLMMATINNLLVLMEPTESEEENEDKGRSSALLSYFTQCMLARAVDTAGQEDHTSRIPPSLLESLHGEATAIQRAARDHCALGFLYRRWQGTFLANALFMQFRSAGILCSTTTASAA